MNKILEYSKTETVYLTAVKRRTEREVLRRVNISWENKKVFKDGINTSVKSTYMESQ